MNTANQAGTPDGATPPVRRVDQLLAQYGASHTHPANELIHFAAIPMIMLSLVGLMYGMNPWLAYLFVAASMVYYARLSGVFLVSMALGAVLMFVLINAMGALLMPMCAGIFGVAWIFQFIGHKIEGKKPSFFEDIQYLWVGPLFVLSRLFLKLGVAW
jgi:uncharacterized membrane protein YGL010W